MAKSRRGPPGDRTGRKGSVPPRDDASDVYEAVTEFVRGLVLQLKAKAPSCIVDIDDVIQNVLIAFLRRWPQSSAGVTRATESYASYLSITTLGMWHRMESVERRRRKIRREARRQAMRRVTCSTLHVKHREVIDDLVDLAKLTSVELDALESALQRCSAALDGPIPPAERQALRSAKLKLRRIAVQLGFRPRERLGEAR